MNFIKEIDEKIIPPYVDATSLPCARIGWKKMECGLIDSKVGGTPYFPKGMKYPRNPAGRPLRLLAQINFEQVHALPGFPTRGLLQFFIAYDDDLYGADFDNATNQKGFRVIFHENPDPGVPQGEIPEFDEVEEIFLPFECEMKMTFSEHKSILGGDDYRFDTEGAPILMDLLHKVFPETLQYETWDDLPDKCSDAIWEGIYNEQSLIGGYGAFTQYDPRSYPPLEEYTVQLLQLDSGKYMTWGDCGIAHFFIRKEDLLRLDFSKVAYTWDCG